MNTPGTPDDGLKNIDLSKVGIVASDGCTFHYEKGLEAWWVENFDKNIEAFERLRSGGKLIWFSNYVPATSSGSALDGLALIKMNDDSYRAIPIEMKAGEVKSRPGDRHVEQLYRYCLWAKKFLSPKVDGFVEGVRPVFLANGISKTAKGRSKEKLNSKDYFVNPVFLEYKIENQQVELDWNDLSK